MIRSLSIASLLMAVALATGCAANNQTANANANDATTGAEATTRPGPDDSEITTTVAADGTRTETRVFHNNPHVAKVVVTTRNGTRTVKAYSPSGEEREINKNEPEDVLEATGEKIASAAGFVADKTKDVAGDVKDGATTVGEKTVDASKEVGRKTAGVAKTVGDETAEGAKTAADKTATGIKKTGHAIKKIIP